MSDPTLTAAGKPRRRPLRAYDRNDGRLNVYAARGGAVYFARVRWWKDLGRDGEKEITKFVGSYDTQAQAMAAAVHYRDTGVKLPGRKPFQHLSKRCISVSV